MRSNLARALFAVLAAMPLARQPMEACAPAPRLGARVSVVDESAVIVWDEAARTEHFIRRATFDAETPDFGFLVPTPTQPVLAEASNLAFTHFERLMQPPILERTASHVDFTPLLLYSFLLTRSRDDVAVLAPPPVRVLDTQRIAGYDAVVLEADDAIALARWLRERDYGFRSELADWLGAYVAARWKITAFKIARDASGARVATGAVRMSFQTERPFFPYREPSDQRDEAAGSRGARLLEVLFLGSARMEGSIGQGASTAWPGRAVWSDRLQEGERDSLARELALRADQLPRELWLTTFMDASSPRPGTDDLYFARGPDQSRIVPPPVVNTRESRIPVPADVALACVGLGLFAIARRRRRKPR